MNNAFTPRDRDHGSLLLDWLLTDKLPALRPVREYLKEAPMSTPDWPYITRGERFPSGRPCWQLVAEGTVGGGEDGPERDVPVTHDLEAKTREEALSEAAEMLDCDVAEINVDGECLDMPDVSKVQR